MADKKPGKVVRLSPKLQKFVEARRKIGETFDACLRRLLSLPAKKEKSAKFEPNVSYALPSQLYASLGEAKGAAAILYVQRKKKGDIERPKEVVVAS